jgi:glyoxylase-like metal-dependent hydrolase (beta-lactamase superfamily II)
MIVVDNVIALDCTAKNGNCFCVKTDDGYYLIDSGMPGHADEIISELRGHHIEPEQIKSILLTHGDVDHIGNVNKIRELTKCKVYADAAEIPYLEKKKSYNRIKKFFKSLLHIGAIHNVIALPESQLGSIKIYKTPGHTPGHVCFKYEHVMFLGDLISCSTDGVIKLLSDKMTFDKKTLINSILNLDVSDVDVLCLAHQKAFIKISE